VNTLAEPADEDHYSILVPSDDQNDTGNIQDYQEDQEGTGHISDRREEDKNKDNGKEDSDDYYDKHDLVKKHLEKYSLVDNFDDLYKSMQRSITYRTFSSHSLTTATAASPFSYLQLAPFVHFPTLLMNVTEQSLVNIRRVFKLHVDVGRERGGRGSI
jgi:hypothetical protein